MGALRASLPFCILFLALVWLPASAQAADPITVLANEQHNEFPNKVTFDLEAEGANDIVRATFYYHVGDSPVVTYARPDFQPGRRAQVEYVLKAKQDYLPPGSEIHYQWLIEDSAGHKLKTDEASLTLDDVRYQWHTLSQGKIELLWYNGDQGFAQQLLDAGTHALDRLSKETGVQVEHPVKVLIYGSQQDLLGALEPKAQEWTGGRSFGELGIVLIAGSPSPSGRSFALRAVPHELSHVVIHQATANPYGDIPRWLDEGLAMRAEGVLEPTYDQALKRAIREGRLISLQSLGSNFPADPNQAALSYAESYNVVQFIISGYGPEKMAQLLSVFHEGSTYDDATQQALGLTIRELDATWRQSLGLSAQSTPVPAASASPSPDQYVILLAAVGALVAGVLVLIRMRSGTA